MSALALVASPAFAMHHENGEDSPKCEMMEDGEMSCPMHGEDGEMNCAMMDHQGDGEGSEGHRMMNHGEGECPMMDHPQMGGSEGSHPHRGDHPTGDQESESETGEPQDHSSHEGHAPE
jgi:hypothetical protein